MVHDTSEIFSCAAKYFFKKYKRDGGSQGDLARELGVTQAYLSAIINGSRSASLELYTRIADKLYGPIEKFLTVGRRIKEGREPFPEKWETNADGDAEHLIARLSYFILDHRRIEKELSDLKEFYESIIENLQSAVLVTDKNNKVIYANHRILDICGISPNGILGKSPFNVEESIPNLEIYQFVQKFLEAYEKRQPTFFENIHVKTPRGKSTYNSGWLIPLAKEDRYEGMICTIRDTSHSHALFSLLIHAVEQFSHATILFHQKKPGELPTIFFANKKFREILGLHEIDPFSHPFEELLTSMLNQVKNKEAWKQFLLKTIKNNNEEDTFILEHLRGRKYNVKGKPIADLHGKHIGKIVTIKEFTGPAT